MSADPTKTCPVCGDLTVLEAGPGRALIRCFRYPECQTKVAIRMQDGTAAEAVRLVLSIWDDLERGASA